MSNPHARISSARLQALLLLAALFAGGLASVRMGTDANWDLRNYHLFSAHAFLHGLTFHHLAAAQIQSFFNPLLNLPAYLLLTALQDMPRLYAFVMGLPAGLCAYLFAHVIWIHAKGLRLDGFARGAAVSFTLALGVTGAAFVPAIGTSTGDMLTAIPIMLAYLLVLREVGRRDEGHPVRVTFVGAAGLLAGSAAGLKLTMVIYAAPLGLMILALLGLRAAFAAGLGMLGGFLMFWGPFAWLLWRETGNPMFPFYNHVFQSPDYLPVASADERFLPRSALQAATYPLWWVQRTSGLVTELQMRDARMAIGYIASICLALGVFGSFLRRRVWAGRRELLLLGVAMGAYILWVRLFGIYRYLVVLEMLAALVTMVALILLLRQRCLPVLTLILVLCLATTDRPNWGHIRFATEILEVEPMPVGPGALVGFVGDQPQAYLVPFMPPSVRVLGLKNNLISPQADHGLLRRIRAAIREHEGEAWTVTEAGSPPEQTDTALAAYGLEVTGTCTLVRTSFERGGHRFCPVRKAGDAASSQLSMPGAMEPTSP
jgi:hypothetical protein